MCLNAAAAVFNQVSKVNEGNTTATRARSAHRNEGLPIVVCISNVILNFNISQVGYCDSFQYSITIPTNKHLHLFDKFDGVHKTFVPSVIGGGVEASKCFLYDVILF